jgi:hypothetical protein
MGQRKTAPGTLRDKEVGQEPTALSRLQIIQIVLHTGRKCIISSCTIHRKLCADTQERNIELGINVSMKYLRP